MFVEKLTKEDVEDFVKALGIEKECLGNILTYITKLW